MVTGKCSRSTSLRTLAIVIFLLGLGTVGGGSNVDPLKVEIKTEAPPERQTESTKACYEFLHGKLHARRNHGDTWQNGIGNCMNCTCDNGETRCIFHFCKGPPTGFMTPPSINESEVGMLPDSDTYPEEYEESSGYPPYDLNSLSYDDDDSEDDQYLDGENDLFWPIHKGDKEKSLKSSTVEPIYTNFEHDTSGFESEVVDPAIKSTLDKQENETHQMIKSYFCGQTCRKLCKFGFKVNPITGCLKCHCNKCTEVHCTKKCSHGHVYDSFGCRTCTCRVPGQMTADGDITFISTEEDQPSTVVKSETLENDIAAKITNTENSSGSMSNVLKNKEDVDTLVSTIAGRHEDVMSNHILSNVEKDWMFLSKDGGFEGVQKDFDGIPSLVEEVEVLHPPSWAHPPTQTEETFHVEQTSNLKEVSDRDEATVKSVAKSNSSDLLLLILIPLGVIMSIGTLFGIGYWRRYHRDKYDINTFRPTTDEREKLRPVTVLADEKLSTSTLETHLHV